MLDRLKSRKLWVTVFSSALVALVKGLGIEVSDEQIASVTAIVVAYVASQGYVDSKAAKAEAPAIVAPTPEPAKTADKGE
jgi:uncharacterized membrane protein (DUF441 family)